MRVHGRHLGGAAAYCARAGIPALVFLPAGKITDEQLVQPIANFALTVALDTDFDGCMALVARFCQAHGVYLANSMNPLRMEGQKTLSVELCQQLDWEPPDFVVVPGGNLGNVTAIGKGFLLLQQLGLIDRLPRLCVAQARAANPLLRASRDGWRYQSMTADATRASAIRIGAPVNVHKAIAMLRRFDGLVEDASEEEISAASTLGDRHGLYTDPHTAVALVALGKLRGSGAIPDPSAILEREHLELREVALGVDRLAPRRREVRETEHHRRARLFGARPPERAHEPGDVARHERVGDAGRRDVVAAREQRA